MERSFFTYAAASAGERDEHARARLGAQAEIHERELKACVFAGKDQIAVQEHRRPNADRDAADSCNDRLWK
jgi:hypothetical protein